MNHFFYSLITFIIALFFILLGILCILLRWMPVMRTELIHFLLENSIAISLFGAAFLAIGSFIVAQIILNSKKRYYEFKIGSHEVAVDEELIHKYLQIYFEELFPNREVPCRLEIHQNKLHVTADLPYVPEEQREILTEKIQIDLKNLFRDKLGYSSEYYLSTSFLPVKAPA